jgi:hypothetical protein
MSWSSYKREYEDALDDAGVFDTTARREILRLLRSINTLQDRLRKGARWEVVNNSQKREETERQAEYIEDYFWDEWQSFSAAMGWYKQNQVNIGDFLA